MPRVTTIYWRDIPAQVVVKQGRKRAKKVLPSRFQEAIDRAAMRAKKISADAYLDDWRQEMATLEGDITALVDETSARLEAEYADARLDTILRNKGIDPAKPAADLDNTTEG